jgi:hypothetical protein
MRDSMEAYGARVLRVLPISCIVKDRNFCKIIFKKEEISPLKQLTIPDIENTSNADPICDSDDDVYSPPISVDYFISLLSEYSNWALHYLVC